MAGAATIEAVQKELATLRRMIAQISDPAICLMLLAQANEIETKLLCSNSAGLIEGGIQCVNGRNYWGLRGAVPLPAPSVATPAEHLRSPRVMDSAGTVPPHSR